MVILFIVLSLLAKADQDPRSSSRFYIQHYGQLVTEVEPFAQRAMAIFSGLVRIADNAKTKVPSLILINSESWPWAIALPDNSIVLTKGALELCYANVSKQQGDTRLAMLLGHELAHLAEDDYWHRDVYLALTDNSNQANEEILQFIGQRSGLVQSTEWKNIVRDRELRADDRGAIYASLAGYDLADLFMDNETSFFQYWAQNTVSKQSDYYLTAKQRAEYIKARLTSLINLPQAYKAGLGLISMGYLEQAEVLYKSILRLFPAHEVYNNLGYLKLAQIKNGQIEEQGIQFWLPLELDINPSTPILLRGDDFIVHENLTQSIKYFELAVERRPAYRTGILNLTSAYFLARRYNKASAVIEDAQKRGISDAELELMNLLVLYASLKDKVAIQKYVIEQLEQLIKQTPGFFMASFNLAQIYELENQTEQAQNNWQSLAQFIGAIPVEYQKVVAQKAKVKQPDQKKLNLEPLMVLLQNQIDESTDSGAISEDYDSVQLTIWPTRTKTFYQSQPLLNSINLSTRILMDVLEQCCGRPRYKQISLLGELWIYPDGITALLSETAENSVLLLSQPMQDRLLQQGHRNND